MRTQKTLGVTLLDLNLGPEGILVIKYIFLFALIKLLVLQISNFKNIIDYPGFVPWTSRVASRDSNHLIIPLPQIIFDCCKQSLMITFRPSIHTPTYTPTRLFFKFQSQMLFFTKFNFKCPFSHHY